jgi:hypothetical protein
LKATVSLPAMSSTGCLIIDGRSGINAIEPMRGIGKPRSPQFAKPKRRREQSLVWLQPDAPKCYPSGTSLRSAVDPTRRPGLVLQEIAPTSATPSRARATGRLAAELLLVAVAYFILAKAGQLLSAYAGGTPLWPAAGLGLAAVLLCGLRVWPAIFVAAFAAIFTGALVRSAVGARRLLCSSSKSS